MDPHPLDLGHGRIETLEAAARDRLAVRQREQQHTVG
jgi:hypothetical protein